MKVQRRLNPLRVYENQIPFHIPFEGFMKGFMKMLTYGKKGLVYVALS